MIDTKEAPAEISSDIVTKVQTEIDTLLAGGKIIKISNQAEFENSNALILNGKKLERRIEATRKATVQPRNDAVTRINAWFSTAKSVLSNMVDNVANEMRAYEKAQQVIADENRRQAELKAAEQRRKLEAKEQKKRDEAEALRVKAAELKRKAEKEKDAAKKEALLKEQGNAVKDSMKAESGADQAAQNASVTVADVEPVAAPKMKGRSIKVTYDIEITDEDALKQHLASTGQLHYFIIDVSGLKAGVKASKGKLSLPGMKVIREEKTILRTA